MSSCECDFGVGAIVRAVSGAVLYRSKEQLVRDALVLVRMGSCVASPCDYGISTVSVVLSAGVTRIGTVRICRGTVGVGEERMEMEGAERRGAHGAQKNQV